MSLVTLREVRDLVTTALTDPRLQVVIDREEQAVIDLYGAHYVDTVTTITETHPGVRTSIYLRRRVLSVSSVTEKRSLTSSPDTLTQNTHYYVWPGEGRLERLSNTWGAVVTVTYVPQDDTARRKAAIIELVRLALERTAMKRENVASEYSYEAPDWEVERARILRSLGFMEV